MRLADLIAPDRVLPAIRVADKTQLLAELARRAASSLGIDPKAIQGALEARERLGSTGLGRGFALPHARIAGIADVFALFAQLRRPIEFQAIDGEPVDLAVLLLIPDRSADSHIAALAAVAKPMRDPEFLRRLRKASSPTALHALLATV